MAESSSDHISGDANNDKSDNASNDKSNNVTNGKSENVNDDKSENINDPDTREAARRKFYKKRIRRDNFRLEIDETTSQEERRRLLLEYQKRHRDKTVNAARGILEEGPVPENEDYMDAEEYRAVEEYMEIEEHASSYYRISRHNPKVNRMMLSEWMLDVPQDLTENWIMVPCPIGKRIRLISGWGETRAYSRKGNLHWVFPSALPGGNPDGDVQHSAAIDCIWVKSQKLFYVLDVLYWSLLPFTNCEAEFRLYWIKNKFQEIPEFKERGTDTNKYPILTLPNIDCNSDLSSAMENLDKHPLDGLLFYHRKALYIYGRTPLVTWLKPFMLPEVLGISVPSSFDEKPNDYINFEHYMQKLKAKKKQDTTKIVTNSMDIEGVV